MSSKVPANIVVRHAFNGHRDVISPENDGCLGSWNDGNFDLEVAPLNGVSVIRIDKEKNISYPRSVERGRRQLFVIQIPLLGSEKLNAQVTKFPSNHIKLIHVSSNLWFYLWEVSIVAQPKPGTESEIYFFLTTQLCYSSNIFKNEQGDIVMPGYEGYSRWRDLQDYVELNVNKNSLPVSSVISSSQTPKPSLKDNEGIILWYNLAQGIGVIQTSKVDARVNWRDIQTKERFRHLAQGQKVTFERLVPARNTHKHPRLTKFTWDAEGVAILS